MKYLILIFAFLFTKLCFTQEDCGPSRLINNGGESQWIEYNPDNPAGENSIWTECEERVFVNVESYDLLGEGSEDRKVIYVDYPFQTGSIELQGIEQIDDTTSQEIYLTILPWHITPEIAKRFKYEGEIPQPEDIYVHANPIDPKEECPTKHYYELRYRKNQDGKLQYKWRYTESEYYKIPDPFEEIEEIVNGECLDFGEGDKYTPMPETKFTRIYDGGCNKRTDTNGDELVVSGAIISHGGGTLNGNTFSPKEDNWELIFTGSLEKKNGQFADFVVEQIK